MNTTKTTRRGNPTTGYAQCARRAHSSGASMPARDRRHPKGEGCPNLWRLNVSATPPAQVSPTWRETKMALSTSTEVRGGV